MKLNKNEKALINSILKLNLDSQSTGYSIAEGIKALVLSEIDNMNKSKYLLELSAEEAIMLYDIVRHDRLYQSSYEPLKELIKKIGIVAKDIKR